MSDSQSDNIQSEKTNGPTEGITDEQLPDDLVASEDNPLAETLSEDEVDVDDLDLGTYDSPGQDDDEELED
jgi:hypothetical protein